MARTLSDPADTALMSGHAGSARREGRLMRFASLGLVLAFCTVLLWFMLTFGSALRTSLERYQPACLFATTPEGCLAPDPPAYP